MPTKSPGLYVNDVLYQELTLENCGVDAKKVKALITQANTECILPEGVTSIEMQAFINCTSLTSITIPDSVTSIWQNAFYKCTSLTSVTIGNSVTRIGLSAFYNCTSLTSVTIGNSVTTIGDDAFYGCSALASITIPDSVTSIGQSAFNNCTSLASITIPNKVTIIGTGVFNQCISLTSATIGDSVTSIGSDAFNNCKSLTSIAIPDSVISIGLRAFNSCKSLTSVTIPDSVTSIGQSAFANCTALTSVTIGDGVTSIGESVFDSCGALTRITIPDSITSIGVRAFASCSSLTSITIPDSVTSIGALAFGWCTSLTSITISESITSIEASLFYQCISLTSITIPDSVTSIGMQAFVNCTSLTSITIPDSVTSIGQSAFVNCTALTSVTIGDGVTSIGQSAFANCTALTSVTIPDSVTSIGQSAFDSCGALTRITIPDSITSIGVRAFASCSSLTSITIPDSVTSIGALAFGWCTSLTRISIPDSVTSIGLSAFNNCTSLTRILYQGTSEQFNTLLSNVSSGNSKFLNATVYYVTLVTYQTNGGILEEGFDNPTEIDTFPDPMPTCSLGAYLFDKWYYDNNTFTNPALSNMRVTAPNIYARYYNTITYVLNDGVNSALNNAEYTPNDVTNHTPIYAPIKEGYNFDSWYLESTFETQVQDMSDFSGSAVTLYAKFEEKVSYKPNFMVDKHKQPLPLDAQTVRGQDPYVSYNISALNKMQDLYQLVNTINAKNQHAYFDASSFIDGAYVCLIKMNESVGKYYCEIIDLLNNHTYYNQNGFDFNETISHYISSCYIKDGYTNINISGLSTLGELKEYIEGINNHGDHALFDFSGYIPGAYVCTVQLSSSNLINYCFIFDILNGKLYGSYTGYDDDTLISEYTNTLTGTVSDVIHAIKVDKANITVQEVIQLINRVNIIEHHVFLDVSALNVPDYLITFTYAIDGSNTICRASGLVNGVEFKATYTSAELTTVTFAEFLANASAYTTEAKVEEYLGTLVEIGVDGQTQPSEKMRNGAIFFERF